MSYYSVSRSAVDASIRTNVDNTCELGGSAMTVRYEFCVRTPTTVATLFDITSAGNTTATKLRIGTAGTGANAGKFNLLWYIKRATTDGQHYSPDNGLVAGRWYVAHITQTSYTNGTNPTVSVYIDGASVGTGGTGTVTGSGAPVSLVGVGSRIYVSGRPSTAAPSSMIRRVRVWNRVLSAAECAADAVTEIVDETARVLSADLSTDLTYYYRDGVSAFANNDTLITNAGDVARVDVDDLLGYDKGLCLYLDARSGMTDAITYSAGTIQWVTRQLSAWTDRSALAYWTNNTGSALYQPFKGTFPFNYVSTDGINPGSGSTYESGRINYLTPGVISVTGASWVSATKTLTKTGAFTNFTLVAGLNDKISVVYSDGATPVYGVYTIASKSDNDNIVLATSFGGNATFVDAYGGVGVAPNCNSRNTTLYAVVASRNCNSGTRTLLTSASGGIKLMQGQYGQIAVNGVASTAAGGIMPAGLTVWAAVCSASSIKIYRDGVLVDTLAAASNADEVMFALNNTVDAGPGFEGAYHTVLLYQDQHTAATVGAVTNILVARANITVEKSGVLYIKGSSSPSGLYALYNETATWRLSHNNAFKHYRIYNFGQGGEVVSGMTTTATNEEDKVIAGVADVVGIIDNIGSNDITSSGLTDAQVVTNLATYVSGRRAVCPSMKIVATTVQPRSGMSNDGTKAGYADALNAALPGLSYLDTVIRRDLMWQFKSDGSGAATQPYSGAYYNGTTHRGNAGFDAEFWPLMDGIMRVAGAQRTLGRGLGVRAGNDEGRVFSR